RRRRRREPIEFGLRRLVRLHVRAVVRVDYIRVMCSRRARIPLGQEILRRRRLDDVTSSAQRPALDERAITVVSIGDELLWTRSEVTLFHLRVGGGEGTVLGDVPEEVVARRFRGHACR